MFTIFAICQRTGTLPLYCLKHTCVGTDSMEPVMPIYPGTTTNDHILITI